MRNFKKFLSVLVVITMMASTMVPVFADTPPTAADIVKGIGVLKGNGNGVDATYLALDTQRIQAAIIYLRLLGKEAEARAYTGNSNFKDANIYTDNTVNLLAYLKANPKLGWQGDGKNFYPKGVATPQMTYKVLLTSLGYKEGADFAYSNTIGFANKKGLKLISSLTKVTNNDLAIAMVEALSAKLAGSTTSTLANKLVDLKVISDANAVLYIVGYKSTATPTPTSSPTHKPRNGGNNGDSDDNDDNDDNDDSYVTPAAPAVTIDDALNTVTGMATGMEYKLDAADYVVYDATAFGLLDFSGAHTLLVRVAAEGINPVGSDTTLTFTVNAAVGALAIVGTPIANLVLGNLSVTVNDQTLVKKVLVNGVDVYATLTPANNVYTVPITDTTDNVVFVDAVGNNVVAQLGTVTAQVLTATSKTYNALLTYLSVTVNDSSLVKTVTLDGVSYTVGATAGADGVAATVVDGTRIKVTGLTADPTAVVLVSNSGLLVTVQ